MNACLALFLLLAGCGGNMALQVPPVPMNPQVAALQELPLHTLQERLEAAKGRDDLAALDERAFIGLAWRNRSPASVGDDLSLVPGDRREEERALREAWRGEHVAFSWDNLNPDAQLEPRPDGISLTWLELAAWLPEARNGNRLGIPWVDDYFQRKAWYEPRPGQRRLSMVDQVQIQGARTELGAYGAADLEAWMASLPRPGMSPEEAALEASLARGLLAAKEGAP